MFPIPSTEKLIETKTCRHCSEKFPITDKDLEFYEKVSPTFGGKKYPIPTPTLCPDCRLQRRLSFRNERKLYKRKCDLTGKEIISFYSPDNPYKVYDHKDWWSDNWDPMSYERDYDFKRSFFEQFQELALLVPMPSLQSVNDENSAYCNFTKSMKKSYLAIGSSESDEVYYSYRVIRSHDVVDSSFVFDSSIIFDSISITRCHDMLSCRDCQDSRECTYCIDCNNCHHCFGCINLRDKSYCIFQIQYTPEEYEKEIQKIHTRNKNEIIKKTQKWGYYLASHLLASEHCLGDEIKNSINCLFAFGIQDGNNLRYSHDLYNHARDMIDCFSCYGPAELSYESCSTGASSSQLLYCENTFSTTQGIYLRLCSGSSNLFGCISLKNKQYCILNKQYTKEEYETLIPKIIEHMKKTWEWGEFFPSSLSPFGYNETVAQEYFPLTRRDALQCISSDGKPRFNWSDHEAPFPKVEKIIPASKLPEDITKIPDDILNWAIECEVTKKPFRIIKQELEFYRKHNLPIPRRHPDQRHLDRMALRNPRKLFERKCDKCKTDMLTTYAPERPETVYCETCYNKEVIG